MNYICVEGNIGAGKTTFVNRFAEITGRSTILERFSDNPFLAAFYNDPKLHAFPLEMSFLAERFQQLNQIFNKPDLFSKGYIADYSFIKTLLFAEANLTPEEFELFRRFYLILEHQIQKPDLTIYLQTDLSSLKSNIRARSRSYEKNIPVDYLKKIKIGYQRYVLNTNRPRLITIKYNPEDWENLDTIILELVSEIELLSK